jgi:trk system potassium uptake protein TrkA
VRNAQNELTHVYEADGRDKRALEQLGFQDLTHVLVSVGGSIEASAMITLYLKELGDLQVWVKALSEDHAALLEKVGADEVIFPEQYAALQYAYKLAVPGVIEYLPFGKDVALKEITVDEWAGKTLRDIDMTKEWGVQAIAVRKAGEESYHFVPTAEDELSRGDVLVIIGHTETLARLDAS